MPNTSEVLTRLKDGTLISYRCRFSFRTPGLIFVFTDLFIPRRTGVPRFSAPDFERCTWAVAGCLPVEAARWN